MTPWQVRWKPQSNTQRGAVRRFGDVWFVILEDGDKVFIATAEPAIALSAADARWVKRDQITEWLR